MRLDSNTRGIQMATYDLVTVESIMGKQSTMLYHIFETSTKKIIETHRSGRKAKDRYNFFMAGGGFDGWTPQFIRPGQTSG